MNKRNSYVANEALWEVKDGLVAWTLLGLTGKGIPVELIVEASKSTPMATVAKRDERDVTLLLGCMWDAAVCIRERMITPMHEGYAAIKELDKALKEYLGPKLFEKFLRPSASVGLPPAK